VNLAHKAFSIFKRDALLFIVNLLTGVLVARMLGPLALGAWLAMSLVVSYSESLGRIKTDAAAVYLIGKKIYKREDILFNMNLISLASSVLILSIIYLLFNHIYDYIFDKQLVDYRLQFALTLGIIPLQFFYLNFTYFHIAEENYRVHNSMVFIQAITNVIFLITMLFFFSAGVWAVVLSSIFSMAAGLIFGYVAIDKLDWKRGRPSKEICWDLIKSGFNFYLGGVANQLQLTGINMFSAIYLRQDSLAFLTQGQGVGRLLQKFVDPACTVIFSRTSRSNEDVAIKNTCVAFRVSCILLFCGAVFLSIFGKAIVILLYGLEFERSATVMLILIPGLVINNLAQVLINFFYGINRANLIPRMQVVPLIIQLILGWLFIQHWGLMGIAAAMSFGLSIYGLIVVIVFLVTTKTPALMILPGSADLIYIKSFISSKLNYS